jgi:thiamine pyrophosphokinase
MGPVCYIFGAMDPEGFNLEKKPGDLLIAADGGYAYLEKAGFIPDLAIGDFDSLGAPPEAEHVICFPPEKDYTDLDLAIREGKRRGFRIFCIYGALGGRLDHTIANIQLLAALTQEGSRGYLLGGGQAVTVLEKGELCFTTRGGGYFSAFAFGGPAGGVDEQGLKYTLTDGSLEVSFPLGVSNEFCGREACVSVREGKLLLIWDQDAAQFDPHRQVI